MIRSIIIDEDQNGRELLSKLLVRYFDNKIIVLDKCDSVKKGVNAINKHNPDIVFLDIQKPNENGFELFKYFDKINFEVIFTTAHEDYAIDAIRHSAFLDYLLKPISYMDLMSSIKHYEVNRDAFKSQERISLLLDSLNYDNILFNKVALPTHNGYELQKLGNILYCKADSNYCKVICIDGKELLLSKTLKFVEELFANKVFFRIHKSYLVNMNYIIKFDKIDDLKITLTNGVQLPVSVRKKEQFLNAILKNK